MSRLSVAARGMIGLGLGMLILALVVRPSIRNPASRWADTGSIIISLLMVAAGVVVARREATKEAGHDDEWDLTDDPRP